MKRDNVDIFIVVRYYRSRFELRLLFLVENVTSV